MSARALSPPPLPADDDGLLHELREARAFLLAASEELPAERWAQAPSAAWSPVGWHVGHAAATQARWLLPGDAEAARYGQFFDPFATGKAARSVLPPPAELRGFLAGVGARVEEKLQKDGLPPPAAPGLPREFLLRHLAQHDLQHAEHVRVISALLEGRLQRPGQLTLETVTSRVGGRAAAEAPLPPRVEFAGGETLQGNEDAAEAYDNERPAHRVGVAPFWLDRALTTVAEYSAFVEAGGYREPRFWSGEGLRFLEREQACAPLGWRRDGARWVHPDGPRAAGCPVTSVSFFEAEAYARFRGARLPSEQEWEHAQSRGSAAPRPFAHEHAPSPAEANVAGARRGVTPVAAFPPAPCGLYDAAGNVWEWTTSWFDSYAGFAPYPYDGYSTPWFGTHRVLRGGSWATAPRLCRVTFRNWYEPGFREIPAGLRCAGSL